MRRVKINQKSILKLVNDTLHKLPPRYVTALNCKESRGKANVNVGQTKYELDVYIWDSEVPDWTKAPCILHQQYEDSDGVLWWEGVFAALCQTVNNLIEKETKK